MHSITSSESFPLLDRYLSEKPGHARHEELYLALLDKPCLRSCAGKAPRRGAYALAQRATFSLGERLSRSG